MWVVGTGLLEALQGAFNPHHRARHHPLGAPSTFTPRALHVTHMCCHVLSEKLPPKVFSTCLSDNNIPLRHWLRRSVVGPMVWTYLISHSATRRYYYPEFTVRRCREVKNPKSHNTGRGRWRTHVVTLNAVTVPFPGAWGCSTSPKSERVIAKATGTTRRGN